MKPLKILFPVFISLLIAVQANAQDRWSAELRGGVANATQKLGEAELEPGIGFDAIIAYAFMPHLAVYTGWGWNQFKSESSANHPAMTFEETGYTLGLQFIHPVGKSELNYMIRGGGMYKHIELENSDGDIESDSSHVPGWELEAGLEIPLSDSWQLRPTARYRSLSTEMEVNGVETEMDLTYTSVGIGIANTF